MRFKFLVMGMLLCAGTAFGQFWNTNYPSNVRYIAGGYSNHRPFFSTLNTALNDVKAYATSDNPYVFWLMSDTLNIADWDSVYNEGVSMSDSIYTYYVATGKIKWAGFDIDTSKGGRGGSSILNYGSMAATTDNYDFARWDSSGLTLSQWQIQLTQTLLTIDSLIKARTLFSEMDPTYFTISGDSLYIVLPTHIFDPDSFYTNDFDSTSYLRSSGDEAFSGTFAFNGGNVGFEGGGAIQGSSLQLPSTMTLSPRGIWSDGSWLYFRQGGVTYKVALLDSTKGTLFSTGLVEYEDLQSALKDTLIRPFAYQYLSEADTLAFTTSGKLLPDKYIDGVTSEMTASDSSLIILETGYYEVMATFQITTSTNQNVAVAGYLDDILEAGLTISVTCTTTTKREIVLMGVLAISAGEEFEVKFTGTNSTSGWIEDGKIYLRKIL